MSQSEKEDPLVALAKKAITEYVRGKGVPSPETSESPELQKKAGVFICLKKHGHLRGCIGTIEPTKSNLAEEIVANAISAAVEDPRFDPVTANELDDLKYSVDVLGDAEPIDGMEELDPKVYGVIVVSGRRRGLLLPDLEGINTPEEQVDIAIRKAGIGYGEPISLYRFRVTRHE